MVITVLSLQNHVVPGPMPAYREKDELVWIFLYTTGSTVVGGPLSMPVCCITSRSQSDDNCKFNGTLTCRLTNCIMQTNSSKVMRLPVEVQFSSVVQTLYKCIDDALPKAPSTIL